MAEKEEILSFGVFVDIRDALKSVEKFQKEMSKSLGIIAKSGEKMGKVAKRASQQATDSFDDQSDAVDDLTESYGEAADEVSHLTRVITELSNKARKAHGEERKTLEEEIKHLKKIEAERKKAEGTKPPKGGMLFGRVTFPKVKSELKKAGEELKEPLQAFLSKDAKGLVRGLLGSAAANLKRGGKLTGSISERVGRAASAFGERKAFEAKSVGGVKGKMLGAVGGGMKGVGGILKGLSGALKSLSSLGPILGVVGGGLMALIKMFIDADAMAKEFNKDILSSASNLDFMAGAQGDVNLASMRMVDTLDQMRKAAFDVTTNLKYGITSDEHKAMLNVLTQEGVTLETIRQEAVSAGTSVKDLATQMTVTSVAYQRAFGVPLQEINQLQAEMITEMGRGIRETQQSFAMMTRAAEDSGIAGNKFFAAIRGVSADLGLYNLRLEDAVTLLSKMGKVMNPRNAQKFMQEVSSGMKTMGRQEKLQMSLLAGTKNVTSIVQRDLTRKTKNMAKRLAEVTGGSVEDITKTLETKGFKGVQGMIKKLPKEVQGAFSESVIDLDLQRTQASKGTFGKAMSTADLGIGGALELQQKALTRFTGGKSITEALGTLGLEQVADKLGKSDEQVKALAKLEMVMEAQKQTLLDQGKTQAEVDAMGYDELLEGMNDELKAQIQSDIDGESQEKKMLSLAQRQGQMTQSIEQKLKVLVDWLMSTFYDLVMSIWDTILSIPLVGGKMKEKREAMRIADKTGNLTLSKAATADDFKKTLVESGLFQGAAGAKGGALQQKFSTDQMERAVGMSDVSADKKAKFKAALDKRRVAQTTTAMMGPMGMPMQVPAGSAVKHEDINAAMAEAGFSEEEVKGAREKLIWSSNDRTQVIQAMADLVKEIPPEAIVAAASGGGAPAETPKVVEAQSEATTEIAKSNQEVKKAVTQRGIKIAPATIKQESSSMEQAMLSALRTALFEYYLYSGTDRGQMLTAMKEGKITDPRLAAQTFAAGAMAGGGALAGTAALSGATTAQGNAMGGMVTGIANGMAVVAAQGEGLASVAKGEKIVPAGGGGGGVSVVVNGIGGRDLAHLIEGKVTEGIREYKRRERYAP